MSDRFDVGQFRLTIDPIACDGRGLCAELMPEWIELDDWGYPIVRERPDAGVTEQTVRRSIAACPTLALRLVANHDRGRSQTGVPDAQKGDSDAAAPAR
jgi:ferredoxin